MYSIRFWLEKTDSEKLREMERTLKVTGIKDDARLLAWRITVRTNSKKTYIKMVEWVQLYITTCIHHNV